MSEIVRPYTIINEAYFKAYCPVPMNFNMEEILPFFNVAIFPDGKVNVFVINFLLQNFVFFNSLNFSYLVNF